MLARLFAAVATALLVLPQADAARSLAVRAEVRVLSSTESEVRAEVVAQVAPEDRTALGRSPWLTVDLRQGDTSVVRWAGQVDLDDDGTARLEVTVRPGTYEIEVSLTALRTKDRGLWIGRQTLGEAPEPAPTATPRSTPAPPVPARPATPPEVPTPANPETSAEALAAAAEPAPPPSPTATPTATPTWTPTLVPSPTPTPTPPAPPAPEPTWQQLPEDAFDLTLRLTSPGRRLDGRTELVTVRVDRQPVPSTALAGERAPLSVALVIQAPADRRAAVSDQVAPRIASALLSGGGAAAVVGGPSPQWLDRPEAIAEAIATASQELSAPDRLVTALDALGQRPGRRVVLFHTEGGPEATRDEWRQVERAIRRSGAMVFISALSTGDLASRDRRQFPGLAESSGGVLELIETPGLVDKVMEVLTREIRATAVVRLQASRLEGDVEVESLPPASVLAAPEEITWPGGR